jgi:membrane protease YdiL (CAAX protease family)
VTAFLDNVRPTTWRVLIMALVTTLVASWLVNIIVGPVGGDVRNTLDNIAKSTGELVQVPLIVGPFYFAMVGTVIFGLGQLRFSDVGWRLADVVPSLLVTLAFWAAMQPALAIWGVATGGELQWNEVWTTSSGAGRIFGELLSQLLGNALLEEMVFRGFFLPQLYLKASARFRPATALVIAMLGSQLLFAFTHIPNRLFVNEWPVEEFFADQVALFIKGMCFGAVYIVSRNLFVCVGLHALWNQPVRLLSMPFSPGVEIVWLALTLILLLA